MSNRLLRTVTLLAFTALSTAALADEPPATVGRIALAQGQVSVASDGAPPSNALVNWPVTSQQTITTAPGARTELRIGSTSVRLDGGSALEVVQLDDQDLRLRLHYGSAYVRIVNPEVVPGFVLETAQARVRLREPGRVRVDADRAPDTTDVNVFGGLAVVEGAGEELTVRAGRRAEVRDDGTGRGDVRTAQSVRDGFDDWAFARDREQDNARSARYVTSDMTGYEDLDRYGRWSTDAEYGTLWIPSVAPGWVPYRDGSWVWLDPWGWTWVDNAPWGYAPFHYGRWVYVHRHWAWAPGRHERHPVWSPALVGWVGGAGWSVSFGSHRRGPAQGWYPLSPHERYVPTWRASDRHLRWWNHDVRPDRGHDYGRRHGLTVVPHDAFTQRERVPVGRQPHATMPPPVVQAAPAAAPPPPRERREGREPGRRDGHDRFERGQRPPAAPAPVLSNRQQQQPGAEATAPRQQGGRQVIVAAPPAPGVLTAPPVAHRGAPWDRGRREQQEDARRQQDAASHQQEEIRRQQEATRRQQDDVRRQQEREQAGRPSAMPAPAPAPLQAVPSPVPGEPPLVGHGRPPHGFAERERRQHQLETAPPPSSSPLASPPATARPFPLPQQARPEMEPPAAARPLPLPPQARPRMEPPETARPMPMPPQVRAQMAPPEAARPMPPPQAMPHPAPPAPPAAAPQREERGHQGEQHGHGGNPRMPRQQER